MLVDYSPPQAVVESSRALEAADPAARGLSVFDGVAEGARPYPMAVRAVEDEDLDDAPHPFEGLRRAYARAGRLGQGVAVSYG